MCSKWNRHGDRQLIFLAGDQGYQGDCLREDGAVFFRDAYERGALRPLADTYSGYLHTLPRLVGGFSLLVPLEHAPLVFNLAAFLIMLVPILYLMSDRMAEEVPSLTGRILMAAAYAVMPASHSVYANITSAQWHLAVTACLICASGPPVTAWQRAADAALLGLFALSSPLAPIFIPIVAWRTMQERRGRGGAAPFAALAILCLGFAVQAIGMLGSPRIIHSSRTAVEVVSLAKELVMFGLFNAILGVEGNLRHYASFGPAMYLFGLGALIFLVVAALRDRSRLLLIVLYAAMAVFVLRHAFPLPGHETLSIPNADTRYYHLFVLFTLWSAVHVALHACRVRYAGIAILAPALCIGIRGDYLLGPANETHYADQVAVFRTLPKGTSFSFPILPFPWRFTLTNRENARGPSPLASRRALVERTYSRLAPVEVPHNGVGWVVVKGLAIDEPAGKPAGGVFVVIDGRFFPAVTGLAAVFEQTTLPSHLKNAAFMREVPREEIGPGVHTVHLIVLSHDRRSYFQPTAATTFELPK